MITSNYYAYMASLNAQNASANIPNALRVKDINGTLHKTQGSGGTSYRACALLPTVCSNNPSASEATLCFGLDDTAETITDYKISFAPRMTYTVGSETLNYDASNKKLTASRRFIINNNTSSAVTIKEYGVFGRAYTGSSSTTAYILLYRSVLQEPFTLEAGETVNFDLTMVYELPIDYTQYE